MSGLLEWDQNMREFDWPIRIYYEDTDAGGVVYYANYLKFFERARTEMLRAMGFEQDTLRTEAGIVFVVRSVKIDYLKPALFNELLQVRTELSEVKKTRLIFQQVMRKDGIVLCSAEICIACLEVNSMRPTAIPSTLLEQL